MKKLETICSPGCGDCPVKRNADAADQCDPSQIMGRAERAVAIRALALRLRAESQSTQYFRSYCSAPDTRDFYRTVATTERGPTCHEVFRKAERERTH